MKVLFIGTYDSSNAPLINLIKTFEKSAHDVTVCSIMGSAVNDRIFLNNNISVVSVSHIENYLNEFDAVCLAQICGNYEIVKKIKDSDVFIFTLGNLFLSRYINPYADIVFCLGDNFIDEISKKYKHTYMAVGNPQYDSLVRKTSKNNLTGPIKNILFIEQGLYPVGSEGKRELAKVLVNIAIRFKEMTLYIKPRHLIGEKDNQAHKCLDHLYDYIDEICPVNKPENLIMLKEFVDLEELIIGSDCIITPWSTAYIEAGLLGKKLLLISGLPSEDCMEVRSKRVDRAYKKLKGTGCVVHYTEVCNRLSGAISSIDEEYLNKEVYDYQNKCSDKIVETIEFIHHKIIKNKMFLPALKLDYKDYQNVIDNHLRSMQQNLHIQEEGRLLRKLEKLANQYIVKLVYVNRDLNDSFSDKDFEYIWGEINSHITGLQTERAISDDIICDDFIKYLEKVINDFIEKFCTINAKEILSDTVGQAYMIRRSYANKDYDYFENIPHEILCKEAYLYYYGRVLYNLELFQKAAGCFEEFLEIQKGKKYHLTFVDKYDYFLFAQVLLGLSYIKKNQNGQYDHQIEALMTSEIQALIFKQLYEKKEYEWILNFKFPVKAKGSYLYYCGRTFFNLGHFEKAINYFKDFLQLSFEKGIEDITAVNNLEVIEFVEVLLGLAYIRSRKGNRFEVQIEEMITAKSLFLILKKLYENKEFELILSFRFPIKAKGVFLFYYGRIMFDLGYYDKSVRYLQDFIQLSFEKEGVDPIVEDTVFLTSAIYYSGVAYYNLGRHEEAERKFLKCLELTGGDHKKAKEYLAKLSK